MLFKNGKKALSPVLLTGSLIMSCVMVLWLFCSELGWENVDVESVGWGQAAILGLGFVAAIYIMVSFYRSLFLLFGMEMPDGKKSLGRFRPLVVFNLIFSLCSIGAIGRMETYFNWASILTEILIGIVMYVYFRGKGRLFNNCLVVYAVLVVLGLIPALEGNEYGEKGSIMIYDWINTLLIMGYLIFVVVFVFCAKKLYLAQGGVMNSSLPADKKKE